MGIKYLFEIIEKEAPCAISNKTYNDYKGKIIAIDGSIVIYKLVSIGYSKNIVNSENKYVNHIAGLFYKMVKMLSHDITPIVVFDGRPPAIKDAVIIKRKERRDVGGVRIPREVFIECKLLLDKMKIPWVDAAGEAEALCAKLYKSKYIDYCATEDLDYLVFGGSKLIKNMDVSGKNIKEINLTILLEQLEINYKQFIDLCILLGSDYTSISLGRKSLGLIKKYSSIEKLIKGDKSYKDKINIEAVKKARAEFKDSTADIKNLSSGLDIKKIKLNKLDDKEKRSLRSYLIDTHHLPESRIDNALSKI